MTFADACRAICLRCMSPSLENELKHELGEDFVQPAAHPFAAAALRCAPSDHEQLGAILRLAAQHQVWVFPQGAGTYPVCGARDSMRWREKHLPRPALSISLERMQNTLMYSPADLIVNVQAGMSLSQLQQLLNAQRQHLPLDASPHATIGGIVSTNRTGARRLFHGEPRDQVRGLTIVNGDGIKRKCGGQVLKNVTGYALEKLFVGSRGTLGIVTEVTFKVTPLPAIQRAYRFKAASFGQVLSCAKACYAKLPIAALQVFDLQKPEGQVWIEATEPDAERLEAELERLTQAHQAELFLSETYGEALAFTPGKPFTADPTAPVLPLQAQLCWTARPTSYAEELNELQRLAGKHRCYLRAFLQFPHHGGMELYDADHGEGCTALIADLRRLLPSCYLHWKSSSLLISTALFPENRAESALMRPIKAAFDPHGLLNPGGFIEGL